MIKFIIVFSLLHPFAGAQTGPHGGHQQPPQAKAVKETSKVASTPPRKEEPRVAIEVPKPQQSRMGIKIAKVTSRPVENTIRTVGTLTADQTKEAHVHTKINGWIEQISADYIGKPVKKSQPLFDLYSPDLVATQEEYLSARKQGGAGGEIAKAALDRLKLWGVPQKELERLRKEGRAKRAVTFDSPVDGVVINKTAIRGMYVTPEMELYHIADLSRIWIVVTLYEYDVASIAAGDAAVVQLPYDPSKTFNAKISYVYPEIDLETRTAKARIELDNSAGNLKPGMFANVELKKDLGNAVVVPDDAVIDTGVRRIVFVKTSEARFEPREIKVGARVGDMFVVLAGLKSDEEIVTSAHFLIDAESKLQAAMQKGQTSSPGHGGHQK